MLWYELGQLIIMNKDNNFKGRWNRIKGYLNLGITLVTGTFLFLFSINRLTSVFSMENFPVNQLSILLLIETLILIFLWIHATEGELQMYKDYFEEFVPPIPGYTFAITIFFAIFLGLLGFFSYSIVFYSSIFVCFSLVGILGGRIRCSKIKEMLNRARNEASSEDIRRKKWDIIEIYEIEMPHLLRGVAVLFFSFVSLILGLLGELRSNSSTIWLLSAAYSIMFLSIAFAEIGIIKWRHKRDDALGETYF